MPSQCPQSQRSSVPSRKVRENREPPRSWASKTANKRQKRVPTPSSDSDTQSNEDVPSDDITLSSPPRVDPSLAKSKYILSASTFVDGESVLVDSFMSHLYGWNCSRYEDLALLEVQRAASKHEDSTPERTSCVAAITGQGLSKLEVEIHEAKDYSKVDDLLLQFMQERVKRLRVEYKATWTLNIPQQALQTQSQGPANDAPRTNKKRRVVPRALLKIDPYIDSHRGR
jgi:hypothetical protein